VRLVAVERGPGSLESLRSAGLTAVARLEDVPSGLVGGVVANEWLDNEPFHRLRGTSGGVVELFVTTSGHGFELIEGPPSDGLQGELPNLGLGAETVVRPSIRLAVEELARILARGYAVLVDYASPPADEGAPSPSVHGYRDHRQVEDVLADPGSRDITAGVDFGALVRLAGDIGFTTWGPVTQRQALRSLGFDELAGQMLAEQAEALDDRRGIDALHRYSDRNRAAALVARGGLGDFLVLGLGIRAVEPPLAFRRQ
jgi:SAM-dependent MidA family methyltransferase